MNTTKQEKTVKELFVGTCWQYLSDNFHKFTETNKIRIALELGKKDMPNKLEGELNTTVTIMPQVEIDGKPLEVKVGD